MFIIINMSKSGIWQNLENYSLGTFFQIYQNLIDIKFFLD